jgi:hypothetical protein
MTPAEPIQSLLGDSLSPVTAPAELWDRVWQPRVQAEPSGPGQTWLQHFAFILPVAAAAALISMVALRDPLHSPPGFSAAAAPVAKRDSSDIATQLERRQTILTVSSSVKSSERAPGAKADAGCAICHTL